MSYKFNIFTGKFDDAGSAGGSGTVTSVGSGTGLSGGPITTTGTLSLANTAVTPGSYTYTNFTVDAQGRITAASSGTTPANTTLSNLGTTSINTNLLFSGNSFNIGDSTNNVNTLYTGAINSPNSQDLFVFGDNSSIRIGTSGGNLVSLFNDDGDASPRLGLSNQDESARVHLKAPDALSADTTIVFPEDDGSSGYVLSTDGAGNTSWIASGGVLPNNTYYKIRNAANNADLNIFKLDTSNGFLLEDGTGDSVLYANSSNRVLRDDDDQNAMEFTTTDRKLFDASGSTVIDFNNRQFYDEVAAVAVDFTSTNRQLTDEAGVRVLSFLSTDRTLRDNLDGPVMRFTETNRRLYDSSGTNVLDFQTRELIDNASGISINFTDREMRRADGTISIDYENDIIYDTAEFTSIDANSRTLNDSAGTESVNYSSADRVTLSKVLQLAQLSADPGTGSAGDIYYNTTLNKIKFYNGATWETVTSV